MRLRTAIAAGSGLLLVLVLGVGVASSFVVASSLGGPVGSPLGGYAAGGAVRAAPQRATEVSASSVDGLNAQPQDDRVVDAREGPLPDRPGVSPGPITLEEVERRAAVAELIRIDSSEGVEYSLPCLLACEAAIDAVDTLTAIGDASPEALETLLADPGIRHFDPEAACGVREDDLEEYVQRR